MTPYLQVDNLTKSFGDLVLFENISFGIAEGQRIGLIAKNGTGKTTLLNILSGKEGYDSGNIVFRRDLRVDYLEQDPQYPEELTVLEACFHHGNSTVELIKEYERCMETEGHPGLDDLLVRMDHEKAWEYEQKAKQILSQLKIRNFEQQVKHLSGGQLKRVALANALITEPDLLILDEPTNHLDLDMTEWLEEYLRRTNLSLLMVTHDRYFLDRVCSEIIEIDNCQVYQYKGNYSYYLEKRQERIEAKTVEIERSIIKKYRKELWTPFIVAVKRYELIKAGDKIAVCISGGKDSMLMAKLFQELKHHNKFDFDVKFLVMDPGYNEANRHVIEENCRNLGIPATIFESDIFDAVYDIEKSPCYLCARMRRGHLYAFAKELGCNKIALGHHYDDVIETILMRMLYGAQVQTMMPKLHSTNFEGMELIRPMYLIREDDIKHWRDYNDLHFIQCACHFTDTCTTCDPDGRTVSKRMEIKQLIARLKEVNPYVENNIFRSVENVNLSTIIAYKKDGVKHSFLETYVNGTDE